jgi:hypothetical protein
MKTISAGPMPGVRDGFVGHLIRGGIDAHPRKPVR